MKDMLSKIETLDLQIKRFRHGQHIFIEGGRGSDMYYINKGKIAINKQIGAQEHRLAVLTEGDIFGEMAVFDVAPRSATATAMEDSELSVISISDIEKMDYDLRSELLITLLVTTCRKLRLADQEIGSLVSSGQIPYGHTAGFHTAYWSHFKNGK